MKVLVFSDVHGNLPAFERMLKEEPDVSKFVSLGDVVNYGPWSNECVDLLETLPAIKLMGNHEENFLSEAYPGKSELVKLFFHACLEKFSRKEQIAKYQKSARLGKFNCIHTLNEQYIYPDTVIEAQGNYLIGHSHYQFDRREKNYHVINVGSVGQNRKEINVINYAVYYPDSEKVELKSVTYEISDVITKMREMNYPAACVDYYINKPKRVSA